MVVGLLKRIKRFQSDSVFPWINSERRLHVCCASIQPIRSIALLKVQTILPGCCPKTGIQCGWRTVVQQKFIYLKLPKRTTRAT
jgi:hypothetical protein